MVEQSKADMVMRFTTKGGDDVPAECMLDVSPGRHVHDGFLAQLQC